MWSYRNKDNENYIPINFIIKHKLDCWVNFLMIIFEMINSRRISAFARLRLNSTQKAIKAAEKN